MIGNILTISDAGGQAYVEDAREAWRKQGFLIVSMDIETALKDKKLNEYYMIAITMNQEHSFMFREYVRLLRSLAKIPIVLFPYVEEAKMDALYALCEGATQIISLPAEMESAIMNCIALIRQHMTAVAPFNEEPLTLHADYKIFLDIGKYCAHVDGREVELSKTEFAILRLLMEHRGNYLSHAQIYRQVWGEEYADSASANLHNQIKNLRKRLQWKDSLPQYIRTKRGVGYSFSPHYDEQQSA